ncbi:MAG: class D sortase [Oscillospiraceae bacterium]|nr:class D sortase [Oscillospiraceae bacterium]
MKKPVWTGIVCTAALGIGLVLAGTLSFREPAAKNLYENPAESSTQLNNSKDFFGEVNTGKNAAEILSGTETVLEPDDSQVQFWSVSQAETEYLPQTEPPVVTGNYTLPESVQLKDGSIGQLIIEKIDVNAPVYETDDEMEAMRKGIAHYKITSAWDGNVGLCAHNGTASYCWFRDLHKLEVGDEVVYQTALGSRTYLVSTVKEIAETDWSMLDRTEDNRLTMTTCIDGKPEKRLCVQAAEKEDDH